MQIDCCRLFLEGEINDRHDQTGRKSNIIGLHSMFNPIVATEHFIMFLQI